MNRHIIGSYAVRRSSSFPGLRSPLRPCAACNTAHRRYWLGSFPVGGRRHLCWYR